MKYNILLLFLVGAIKATEGDDANANGGYDDVRDCQSSCSDSTGQPIQDAFCNVCRS